MKNIINFLGIVTLPVIIIFAATACSNPAGSGAASCTVIFYDSGNTEMSALAQTVTSGTVITLKSWKDPGMNKAGYTLAGWQISGSGKVYNGDYTVTGDTTFYAKWLDGDWKGIDTAAELISKITDDPSESYFLTADISLANYNSGVWTPIGYDGNVNKFAFSGILEGNGNRVTGLTVNTLIYDYAGLFSTIDGGTVRNLGVVIASGGIIGNDDITEIGGITGILDSGKIINCYTMGNINGDGWIAGGIAGEVNDSEISNCYSTGNISTNNDAGGIAGLVYKSKITNCYSTGNITAYNNAGGIIGNFSNTGEITGCAAINPSIYSDGSAGRIVGALDGGSEQKVEKNIAYDSMKATGDAEFSGDVYNDGVDTLIGAFKDKSTWVNLGFMFGFDDTAPWKMPADGYPVFYWQ